jgi:hypothetical protein
MHSTPALPYNKNSMTSSDYSLPHKNTENTTKPQFQSRKDTRFGQSVGPVKQAGERGVGGSFRTLNQLGTRTNGSGAHGKVEEGRRKEEGGNISTWQVIGHVAL